MPVTNVKCERSKGGDWWGEGWESERLKRLIIEVRRKLWDGRWEEVRDKMNEYEGGWRESSSGSEMGSVKFRVKDTRPQVGWELGTTKALAPEIILGWVRMPSMRRGKEIKQNEHNLVSPLLVFLLQIVSFPQNYKTWIYISVTRDMKYFVQLSVHTNQTNQIYYL